MLTNTTWRYYLFTLSRPGALCQLLAKLGSLPAVIFLSDLDNRDLKNIIRLNFQENISFFKL